MTETETQIIDLLNKGWSYSRIQEELQVSSKTISAVRKVHFPNSESNTDALSRDTLQTTHKAPPSAIARTSNTNLNKLTPKKTQTMSTENDFYEDDEEITSQLELEKFRLKLAHELEMEKIQVAREDKEREHNLREQEIEKVKRKDEEEKRGLLFRIKKVIDSCEDAEYSYEDAENLLEEARKVLSESEKYCFINQITFQGSMSQTLLGKVIATLSDLMDGMDEDDTTELVFDGTFRRQVNRYSFQSF